MHSGQNLLFLFLGATAALTTLAAAMSEDAAATGSDADASSEEFLSERLNRASPLRWGKRSEALRWVKREPLRWGKRSAGVEGMQRMSRESPLRWGKRSGLDVSLEEPVMYRDLRESSPLRWGKRMSLLDDQEDKRAPLRWGKRAPSRFGKRSPSRFGKRSQAENLDYSDFALEDFE